MRSERYPFNSLKNPTDCFCQVWSWLIGHSEMYIQIAIPGGKISYLFFPSVAYFAGPKNWHGVDFQLATPAECLKRTRELHLFEGLEHGSTQHIYGCYTITKPALHVEIIPGDMEFCDELSEHLR